MVEVYDPASDSWTRLQSIGLVKKMGSGAGAIDGKIYVVGGTPNYPKSPIEAVSTVEIFEPEKLTQFWYKKD
jgi:hypothetical protein